MFRRSRQGLVRSFSDDGSFPGEPPRRRRWEMLRKLQCHRPPDHDDNESLHFFPVVQDHGVYQLEETSWDSSDSSVVGYPRGDTNSYERLDSVEEENSDYSSEYMDDSSSDTSDLPYQSSSSFQASGSLEDDSRIGIRPFIVPPSMQEDSSLQEDSEEDSEEPFYVERSALYQPTFSNIIVTEDIRYEAEEEKEAMDNESNNVKAQAGDSQRNLSAEEEEGQEHSNSEEPVLDDTKDRDGTTFERQTVGCIKAHEHEGEQEDTSRDDSCVDNEEPKSEDTSGHDRTLSIFPSDEVVDTPEDSAPSEAFFANSGALDDDAGIRRDQHDSAGYNAPSSDVNLSADSGTDIGVCDGLGSRSLGTSTDRSLSVMAVGSEETTESKSYNIRSVTKSRMGELIGMFETKYSMKSPLLDDGPRTSPAGSEHRQDSVSQAETLSSFSSTAQVEVVQSSPSRGQAKGFFWRSHPGSGTDTETSSKSEVRELPADGMVDTSLSTEEDADDDYKEHHDSPRRQQNMRRSPNLVMTQSSYSRVYLRRRNAAERIVYKAPWMDYTEAGTE